MSIDTRAEKPARLGGNLLGVTMLVVAFVVSLIVSTVNTLRIERPNETIIRIAHWQLEKGYREALDIAIKEYQRRNPGVKIEQMGVTEKLYNQWINTQLISGTAPDLCEMGQSNMLTKDEYTVKYFIPLSNLITRPNPYNANNNLKDTPWKETLLDGMRGGFREGLQEYYGVPTTLISMRLFVNRTLLKQATGSDALPETFGEWMAQCRAIREYAKKTGQERSLIPIVSCYGIQSIKGTYEVPFTSSYERELDLDLNGDVLPIETYIGYRKKQVTLQDPSMQALFKSMKMVGDQMQLGFSGMDRQTAQYTFANQRAAFLSTGSWDASGVAQQAETSGFDLAVIQMPLPAEDEEFGAYIRGRQNEASSNGAGVYGVYKNSKHAEQALDFMMFLTSREGNEILNQNSEWPPLTIGAKPSKLMEPFQPDPRGYNARVNLGFGPRVSQVINAELVNYFQGFAPFSEFERIYNEVILDPRRGGDWAWWNEYDLRRRDVRNKERVLAQDLALELITPGSRDPNRTRRAVLQQLTRYNGTDYLWLFRTEREADPFVAWKDFQPVFP